MSTGGAKVDKPKVPHQTFNASIVTANFNLMYQVLNYCCHQLVEVEYLKITNICLNFMSHTFIPGVGFLLCALLQHHEHVSLYFYRFVTVSVEQCPLQKELFFHF